jgi:hypothetical protein
VDELEELEELDELEELEEVDELEELDELAELEAFEELDELAELAELAELEELAELAELDELEEPAPPSEEVAPPVEGFVSPPHPAMTIAMAIITSEWIFIQRSPSNLARFLSEFSLERDADIAKMSWIRDGSAERPRLFGASLGQ